MIFDRFALPKRSFDNLEFEIYLERQVPNEVGRNYVRLTHASPPARNVSNSGGNMAGSYPTQKTGLTNPFESWTGERALYVLWEMDPEVFETWGQPPTIPITYANSSGKNISVRTTVDFLVLRADQAVLVDYKTETELKTLVETAPGRWQALGNHEYDQLPVRTWAQERGLGYQLITDRAIPHVLVRNIDFLRSRVEQMTEVEDSLRDALQLRLCSAGRVHISEAIYLTNADTVYLGALSGHWSLNLLEEPASLVDSSLVYRDAETVRMYSHLSKVRVEPPYTRLLPSAAISGSNVEWNAIPYRIVNRGKEFVYLQTAGAPVASLYVTEFDELCRDGHITPASAGRIASEQGMEKLARASEAALRAADKRFALLSAFLRGEGTGDKSRATLQRYLHSFETAQIAFENGYIGLLNENSKKGNRTPRITEAELKIVDEAFEFLLQPQPRPVAAGYSYYCALCAEKGCDPISERSFRARWSEIPLAQRTAMREGERAAYPFRAPRHTDGPHIKQGPPEGDSPFQIAHVDHWLSDVFVRFNNQLGIAGKPWVTIIIDSFTRIVLGWWMSLLHPSHSHVLMALRDVVRRHSRLPLYIITDGGKDFQSTLVKQMLARYGVAHALRPASEPRFGNPVERLNLNISDWLSKNTPGSNEVLKKPRLSSKSHDPMLLAELTLKQFSGRCENLLFNIHPVLEHKGILNKPATLYAQSKILQGELWGKKINYNESFLYSTLARPSRQKSRTIRLRSGIELNGLNYWSESFITKEGQKVPSPMYDPEDPTYIYAKVGNKWERCELIDSNSRRLPPQADWKYFLDERIFKLKQANSSKTRRENHLTKGNFLRNPDLSEAESFELEKQEIVRVDPSQTDQNGHQGHVPRASKISWR